MASAQSEARVIEIPDSSLVAGVSRCLGETGRALRDRQRLCATTPLPWTVAWSGGIGRSATYATIQSLWQYIPADVPAGYVIAVPVRLWYAAGGDGSALTAMARLRVGTSCGDSVFPGDEATDVLLTCPILASQRDTDVQVIVEGCVPDNGTKTLANKTAIYVGAPSAGYEGRLSIRRP